MRTAKQADFFDAQNKSQTHRLTHGGDHGRGCRKVARPLERKRPVHVVLKSSQAKVTYGLLHSRHRLKLKLIIKKTARACGIKIHRLAVLSNHIHLFISFTTRPLFQRFLRSISGLIARLVTGARKGKPFGRFWDALAYSRVVQGGRQDFVHTVRYVLANQLEARYGQCERAAYLRDPAGYQKHKPLYVETAARYAGLDESKVPAP